MQEISVFHIMEPSYLVIPERNGASQDPLAGWPQAAVGSSRRGRGDFHGQGAVAVDVGGTEAAQSLQCPCLLSPSSLGGPLLSPAFWHGQHPHATLAEGSQMAVLPTCRWWRCHREHTGSCSPAWHVATHCLL